MRRAFGLFVLAVVAGSCGARSSLPYGPPKPPPPACVVDADCMKDGDLCDVRICDEVPSVDDGGVEELVAKCVKQPPIDCDDGDECTIDACDSTTGGCKYAPATFDLDDDGHDGPRLGYAAGAPGSCGDDCDDTNREAYPGNPEVCDGVDNDCNGVVDDDMTYVPVPGADVRISGDIAPAGPDGLAFSGESYVAAYTGTNSGFKIFASAISPVDSQVITPPGEHRVTEKDADASGGPIVWTGDRYGIAWQDRRDGNYEVFFAFLDASGVKKHEDMRLSSAAGFSVNPALAYNGHEFLVVWQDDRDGIFDVYGQRVSIDGELIGGNVALAAGGLGNESPSVAAGLGSVGVAWSYGDAGTHMIVFQTFSLDMTQPASVFIALTGDTTSPVYPKVVWNNDRYVIAWYDKTASPAAVYAAAVDEAGVILAGPTPVTSPGQFRSRHPDVQPLGDRLLMVYADDRDQNQGYELYTRMISPTLTPLSAEVRVTNAPFDSVFPVAAFGPEGNLGILFRDDREGAQNVYFTHLVCAAGSP